ncbi:MAG: HPF/RaiA family ribosome-associated protein [Myxococcota bacterium]
MTIQYRDVPESPALTQTIEGRKARLEKRHGHLEKFEVVISAPHKHQHKGNAFHCKIEVSTRGHHAVVDKHDDDRRHDDPYVLVRDAFDALEKQLEHQLAQQREHRA